VTPFVHENVSDAYTFEVDNTVAEEGKEIEPNDQVGSAASVPLARTIAGVIGWARDEDVYCMAAGTKGKARFRVRDVMRESGVVLEATPITGGEEGAPVRIHVGGKGVVSPSDVMSPWVGATLNEGTAACLRVRLVGDPWVSGSSTTPAGGGEAYTVEVESQ
jgi:hypothetical protein